MQTYFFVFCFMILLSRILEIEARSIKPTHQNSIIRELCIKNKATCEDIIKQMQTDLTKDNKSMDKLKNYKQSADHDGKIPYSGNRFEQSDNQLQKQEKSSATYKFQNFCAKEKKLCGEIMRMTMKEGRMRDGRIRDRKKQTRDKLPSDDTGKINNRFSHSDSIKMADNIVDIILYCIEHKTQCPLLSNRRLESEEKKRAEDILENMIY